MHPARVALLVSAYATYGLVASALGGCEAKPSRAGAASAEPLPEPEVSARRPTVHFFMARAGEKCESFWQDGEEKGQPVVTACPRDLLPGERLRLAGMTCMREGGSPDRAVPVVCPDPLTNLEKSYRRDRFGAP